MLSDSDTAVNTDSDTDQDEGEPSARPTKPITKIKKEKPEKETRHTKEQRAKLPPKGNKPKKDVKGKGLKRKAGK